MSRMGSGCGLIGFGDHYGLQVYTVAHGNHEFLHAVVALWVCCASARCDGEEGGTQRRDSCTDAHETSPVFMVYTGEAQIRARPPKPENRIFLLHVVRGAYRHVWASVMKSYGLHG